MSDIAAMVLAGGHGRRLGGDKAAAVLDGRPLLQHVLERLPRERTATLLVLRPGQDAPPSADVAVVRDDAALPAGPLRGLVAGLAACPAAWAWVVACDMPGISAALLRGLADRREAGDLAVVPRHEGRLQPLAGLYARRALPRLQAALADGERRLVAAVAGLAPRVLDEAACRELDPTGACFRNINRPADLATVMHRDAGPERRTP